LWKKLNPLPALPHFEKQKWGRRVVVIRILKSKNGRGKTEIVIRILKSKMGEEKQIM
jgi:hypothetical protein